MKISRTLAPLTLAATLGLAACGGQASTPAASNSPAPTGNGQSGAGQTISVQTNNGEVEVPVQPQRVAALDNTSFQTLKAMGITPVAVPKQLLPSSVNEWANDPNITDVGTHRKPKLEALNAAKPDIIVGGKRFETFTDQLNKIAPTVDLAPDVESDDYGTALKAQTTTLGLIFAKPDVAQQLNNDLDSAVEDAAAKTNGQTVFLANHNGGKIDNGAGRLQPLLQPLNMKDVFAGKGGNSESVHQDSGLSPETVAQANPDWMIVMDRDAATTQGTATQARPAQATIAAQTAWDDTTFKSKDQIVYLAPDFYTTEGIQAYTNAYKDIATSLAEAQ